MGAALKLDPTRIKTAEFWKVQGDPLARALRKRFKRDGKYPGHKFQCVYSDELLENKMPIDPDDKGNGSIVHITAIFGFMLARPYWHLLQKQSFLSFISLNIKFT